MSLFDSFEQDLIENPVEIIDSAKIKEDMDHLIDKVVEATFLERGDAILLLIYFNWKINTLNDKYWDDCDQYIKLAGSQFKEDETPESIECEICFEETNNPIGLACGHYFCKDCWLEYLQPKFKNQEIQILSWRCMATNCQCKVNYDLFNKISKIYADRYYFYLKKHYIESTGNLFCPNFSCGRALITNSLVKKGIVKKLECICGQKFCPQCCKPHHNPASCEELEKWEQQGKKDDYFEKLAKPCFHCGCPCERTSGCNHMTCPRCGGQWCWMCLGDWKTHGEKSGGFYKCNFYDNGGTAGNKRDEEAEKAKRFHDIYIKHFDGFIENKLKTKKAKEAKVNREDDIRQVFPYTATYTSILEAFDVLIDARSWLEHSYVASYFKYYENKKYDLDMLLYQQELISKHAQNLNELLCDTQVLHYEVDPIRAHSNTLKSLVSKNSF